MNHGIHPDMLEATRLTRAGHLLEATVAIQRALGGTAVPSTATGTRYSYPAADTAGKRAPLVLDAVPEPIERSAPQGHARVPLPAEAPAGGSSWNNGWFMAQATPGRAAVPAVRIPIPKGPMPRGKCCASSWRRFAAQASNLALFSRTRRRWRQACSVRYRTDRIRL